MCYGGFFINVSIRPVQACLGASEPMEHGLMTAITSDHDQIDDTPLIETTWLGHDNMIL